MDITFEREYKGNSILTNKENQQGCRTDILDKMKSVIDHTTQKHNNVLCSRLDLRYPKDYNGPKNNKDIQVFMSKFIKYFKRNGYDPHYLWVREQSKEKHQHYHLMIAVNGNKMQFPHQLRKKAAEHWASTVKSDQQGLVCHCDRSRQGDFQHSSYRLRRNAPDFDQVYDDCHKRCSYLAKENTKGYAPKRHREFGYSRIPKSIDLKNRNGC